MSPQNPEENYISSFSLVCLIYHSPHILEFAVGCISNLKNKIVYDYNNFQPAHKYYIHTIWSQSEWIANVHGKYWQKLNKINKENGRLSKSKCSFQSKRRTKIITRNSAIYYADLIQGILVSYNSLVNLIFQSKFLYFIFLYITLFKSEVFSHKIK